LGLICEALAVDEEFVGELAIQVVGYVAGTKDLESHGLSGFRLRALTPAAEVRGWKASKSNWPQITEVPSDSVGMTKEKATDSIESGC
jgi:hypothetical protein